MDLVIREMRCGSWTDKGTRSRNEDHVQVDPSHCLMAIADGMGGHPRGDEASQMAIEISFDTLKGQDSPESLFEVAIQNAHCGLADKGDNRGSTLTMARIVRNQLYVVHVGDCRLYVDGTQVTKDHGQGEMLNEFVGGHRAPRTSHYRVEIQEGSWIVMTTDGVHDTLPLLETIPQLIARTHGHPEEIARQLVTLAIRCGSSDNCSALVAQVTGHGF